MEWGLGCVTGELYKYIGKCQRRNIVRCRHPDEAKHIDQRAKENVWTAATPGSQSPMCPIAQHTEKWIGEEGDKSAWNEYVRQCRTFGSIAGNLENLAGKNDNTKGSPMKVKRETENTDSQDLRPAEPRESDCRAAWSNVFRALLLQSSHWRTSVIILRNGECSLAEASPATTFPFLPEWPWRGLPRHYVSVLTRGSSRKME